MSPCFPLTFDILKSDLIAFANGTNLMAKFGIVRNLHLLCIGHEDGSELRIGGGGPICGGAGLNVWSASRGRSSANPMNATAATATSAAAIIAGSEMFRPLDGNVLLSCDSRCCAAQPRLQHVALAAELLQRGVYLRQSQFNLFRLLVLLGKLALEVGRRQLALGLVVLGLSRYVWVRCIGGARAAAAAASRWLAACDSNAAATSSAVFANCCKSFLRRSYSRTAPSTCCCVLARC